MRSLLSFLLVAALVLVLVGCKDPADDKMVYITPAGYPPPGKVTNPSWQDKIADAVIPSAQASLLPQNPTPPAMAARGHRPMRRKASHKLRAKSRRRARP